MRRLTLVRHAKAVTARDDRRDFDRPLSQAGEAQAQAMASRWARRGPPPDLVLTSPAPRALRTAQVFAQGWDGAQPRLRIDERLYLATSDILLETLHRLDSVGHVLVVGHNPGISDLARRIGGEATRGDLGTAAVLHLEFDIDDWQQIGPGGKPPASIDFLDREE